MSLIQHQNPKQNEDHTTTVPQNQPQPPADAATAGAGGHHKCKPPTSLVISAATVLPDRGEGGDNATKKTTDTQKSPPPAPQVAKTASKKVGGVKPSPYKVFFEEQLAEREAFQQDERSRLEGRVSGHNNQLLLNRSCYCCMRADVGHSTKECPEFLKNRQTQFPIFVEHEDTVRLMMSAPSAVTLSSVAGFLASYAPAFFEALLPRALAEAQLRDERASGGHGPKKGSTSKKDQRMAVKMLIMQHATFYANGKNLVEAVDLGLDNGNLTKANTLPRGRNNSSLAVGDDAVLLARGNAKLVDLGVRPGDLTIVKLSKALLQEWNRVMSTPPGPPPGPEPAAATPPPAAVTAGGMAAVTELTKFEQKVKAKKKEKKKISVPSALDNLPQNTSGVVGTAAATAPTQHDPQPESGGKNAKKMSQKEKKKMMEATPASAKKKKNSSASAAAAESPSQNLPLPNTQIHRDSCPQSSATLMSLLRLEASTLNYAECAQEQYDTLMSSPAQPNQTPNQYCLPNNTTTSNTNDDAGDRHGPHTVNTATHPQAQQQRQFQKPPPPSVACTAAANTNNNRVASGKARATATTPATSSSLQGAVVGGGLGGGLLAASPPHGRSHDKTSHQHDGHLQPQAVESGERYHQHQHQPYHYHQQQPHPKSSFGLTPGRTTQLGSADDGGGGGGGTGLSTLYQSYGTVPIPRPPSAFGRGLCWDEIRDSFDSRAEFGVGADDGPGGDQPGSPAGLPMPSHFQHRQDPQAFLQGGSGGATPDGGGTFQGLASAELVGTPTNAANDAEEVGNDEDGRIFPTESNPSQAASLAPHPDSPGLNQTFCTDITTDSSDDDAAQFAKVVRPQRTAAPKGQTAAPKEPETQGHTKVLSRLQRHQAMQDDRNKASKMNGRKSKQQAPKSTEPPKNTEQPNNTEVPKAERKQNSAIAGSPPPSRRDFGPSLGPISQTEAILAEKKYADEMIASGIVSMLQAKERDEDSVNATQTMVSAALAFGLSVPAPEVADSLTQFDLTLGKLCSQDGYPTNCQLLWADDVVRNEYRTLCTLFFRVKSTVSFPELRQLLDIFGHVRRVRGKTVNETTVGTEQKAECPTRVVFVEYFSAKAAIRLKAYLNSDDLCPREIKAYFLHAHNNRHKLTQRCDTLRCLTSGSVIEEENMHDARADPSTGQILAPCKFGLFAKSSKVSPKQRAEEKISRIEEKRVAEAREEYERKRVRSMRVEHLERARMETLPASPTTPLHQGTTKRGDSATGGGGGGGDANEPRTVGSAVELIASGYQPPPVAATPPSYATHRRQCHHNPAAASPAELASPLVSPVVFEDQHHCHSHSHSHHHHLPDTAAAGEGGDQGQLPSPLTPVEQYEYQFEVAKQAMQLLASAVKTGTGAAAVRDKIWASSATAGGSAATNEGSSSQAFSDAEYQLHVALEAAKLAGSVVEVVKIHSYLVALYLHVNDTLKVFTHMNEVLCMIPLHLHYASSPTLQVVAGYVETNQFFKNVRCHHAEVINIALLVGYMVGSCRQYLGLEYCDRLGQLILGEGGSGNEGENGISGSGLTTLQLVRLAHPKALIIVEKKHGAGRDSVDDGTSSSSSGDDDEAGAAGEKKRVTKNQTATAATNTLLPVIQVLKGVKYRSTRVRGVDDTEIPLLYLGGCLPIQNTYTARLE